jgi:hypothetical protein
MTTPTPPPPKTDPLAEPLREMTEALSTLEALLMPRPRVVPSAATRTH